MSESISAFDGNYVRLGQLAALPAQERAQCAADDVMDLFKRSVFAGKFGPPSFEVGETREDPRNWLHMEIEAPRCRLPPDHAALSVRPKQLYGVDRQHDCERVAHDRRAAGSRGSRCWTSPLRLIPGRTGSRPRVHSVPGLARAWT
jgi:hypothetical protein